MTPPRISRKDLERRRAERSTRFFLTGGTGFLGSHIAVALLRRGFRVSLLARASDHRPAADRVRELMDWFGLPAGERRRLAVFEGDITRPGLGIETAALRGLARETDEIIHCASDTSFSERRRAEVEAVNVGGLANVLEFARTGGAGFFHHLSTAFVAGLAAGTCPEQLAPSCGFHNPYEETKWRGEREAEAACREAGVGLGIYRPSVVYGDSRTGRSLLFNAVYYPVRAALFVKDVYERDIRERGGKRAVEMGVRIGPDGTTHLPLRIESGREGGINLVPVDFFTEAFLALMEGAPEGGVFHIVNTAMTRVDDIVGYGRRLFRLTGVRACPPEEFRRVPMNPLEELFASRVKAYKPYMSDTRVFETAKSRAILEARGLVCPRFDYEVFARCMTYAVETGWGARLFNTSKNNRSGRGSGAWR
jgi:nucleoside-diphosphate-sugar epimerase